MNSSPNYLVLNPVFNKFPTNHNWRPYKYIYKDEPYVDFYAEIRWRRVKKFCAKTLHFDIPDITNYKYYKIKEISRLQ
uniref:Uncharacterized protein n=1 Tax=viral metagenome TaxID=1070528 RepID=A0A6C0C4Y3_9ZZZZ